MVPPAAAQGIYIYIQLAVLTHLAEIRTCSTTRAETNGSALRNPIKAETGSQVACPGEALALGAAMCFVCPEPGPDKRWR